MVEVIREGLHYSSLHERPWMRCLLFLIEHPASSHPGLTLLHGCSQLRNAGSEVESLGASSRSMDWTLEVGQTRLDSTDIRIHALDSHEHGACAGIGCTNTLLPANVLRTLGCSPLCLERCVRMPVLVHRNEAGVYGCPWSLKTWHRHAAALSNKFSTIHDGGLCSDWLDQQHNLLH